MLIIHLGDIAATILPLQGGGLEPRLKRFDEITDMRLTMQDRRVKLTTSIETDVT